MPKIYFKYYKYLQLQIFLRPTICIFLLLVKKISEFSKYFLFGIFFFQEYATDSQIIPSMRGGPIPMEQGPYEGIHFLGKRV